MLQAKFSAGEEAIKSLEGKEAPTVTNFKLVGKLVKYSLRYEIQVKSSRLNGC